ncbi:MAG: ATP-binding response regulator [Actinomycetota bacterium]
MKEYVVQMPGSERTGPLRVVIADDTPDIRLLLRSALRMYPDFEVVGEAGDGESALSLVLQERPDAVLLDLAMPLMDGLQVIPEIRAGSPDTKILVLSGFTATEMRPEAFRLGAHGYLEKGASPDRLIGTLRRLCDRTDDGTFEPVIEADEQPPDEMLSYITHELSSPLAVIRGFAELLSKDAYRLSEKDAVDSVNAILRGSKQMQALLDNFSDARRVDTDAVDLIREEVAVGELVRQTAQDMRAVLAPHPVEVDAPDGLVLKIDPVRIRQTLTNLLSNAAKFSRGSESIDISVDSTPNFARICVTDKGPGIPPEARARLFKKFSRLQRSVGGMGLGLYISRGIARAHGGDLSFEAPPDGGSRFVLSLPR